MFKIDMMILTPPKVLEDCPIEMLRAVGVAPIRGETFDKLGPRISL